MSEEVSSPSVHSEHYFDYEYGSDYDYDDGQGLDVVGSNTGQVNGFCLTRICLVWVTLGKGRVQRRLFCNLQYSLSCLPSPSLSGRTLFSLFAGICFEFRSVLLATSRQRSPRPTLIDALASFGAILHFLNSHGEK